MAETASSGRTGGRRLLLQWRGLTVALLVLALVVLGVGMVVQNALPPDDAGTATRTLQSLLARLMLLATVLCGGFALWWAAVGIETLVLRTRARTSPRPGPGRFFGIRLPKPLATTDPHGAAATRGGYIEAVQATDPFRTLATALEAHDGDARIALELWGTDDGRVQWGVWLPADQDLILTMQSLLSGAAPGIDIRPLADPLATVWKGAAE